MLGTAAGLAALIASATACGAVAPSHSADAAESDRPISGVATFANLSRDHVPGAVAYDQVPPIGGAHSGVTLQNCGFYSSSVQDEYAVHSLEHGAVWINYAADLPEDQVEILQRLAHSGTHVLVSPYADLPSAVVASAWGLQLRLESAADQRLEQFVAKYAQGPQTPEPGAPCSGGAGNPA